MARGIGVLLLAIGSAIAPGAEAQGVDEVRAKPPLATSKDWKRVRSAHFTAEGNASEKDLRGAVGQLESFRAALAGLHPGLKFTSAVPTRIIVFSNPGTFTRFKPRDAKGKPQPYVGGYFARGPDVNYIVFGSHGGSENYQTVFHEYAHYVIDQNMTALPLWLNEGLADFYSTFELYKDGRALIGRPPEGRLALLLTEGLRPLDEIITPRETDKMWRDPARVGGFYAESWALVHYLMVGRKPGASPPIASYLEAARKGSSADQILTTAFGMNADAMYGELTTYVRKPSFAALTLPMPANVNASSAAEAMTELDATIVRADLLLANDATEEAEKELKPLIPLASENAKVAIVLAKLRRAQDRSEEGLALLSSAANTDPSSVAAHLYHGFALAGAWRHEEALGAYDRAIAINPAVPAAWMGLSVSELALGRDPQSVAAFTRALSLNGTRDAHRQRAFSALAFGRYAAAVESARTYIAQVGWANESAQYAALAAILAARRLGDSKGAESLIGALLGVLGNDTWTYSVVQYLAGKIDAEQLLSRARGEGQKTEAHTYVGFTMETSGARDAALTHLQWVADRGARNYAEYRMAKDEIERIRHQAQ